MAAPRAFWFLFCPGKRNSSSGRESPDVSDGPFLSRAKERGKERPESPTLALTFALVARGSAYKLADSNNKRRNKSGRKALIASDWGGILHTKDRKSVV